MPETMPLFDPPDERSDDQKPDTDSDMDSTGSGGAPVKHEDLPSKVTKP